MNFLDYSGLQRFLDRLKAIIPTKTSDITNDSGYLDTAGVQNYMENGGGYSQSYIDTALSGKSDTGHTHTKSEITDFPSLATVATSGDYTDLSNKPSINDATLTIQKNSTNVATFTANASSNVTANITVPTAVSELTNDSGYLTSASSLDSSKLTGTIDIARLPKGALERLVTVANQTARYALTVNDVQLGDTVKQLDTGVMYIVVDESKLSSADGYTEYTAGSATSVPWTGVTGKPSDFTPSSHTHGNITNDGKLGTASRALITDSSKNITVSSVTDTELGYLSGVTSSVQTQLNGKAASSHTHLTSDVTDLLSGNHTWTGDNTFSKTVAIEKSTDTDFFFNAKHTAAELGSLPSSDQSITWAFRDKNDDNLCYARVYYETTGGNSFRIFVRNKYTSGAPSTSGTVDYAYFGLKINADRSKEAVFKANLRPYDNTLVYNLGDATYQWSNLYAKNYFYNGTQWGLDRANTWTAQNSFNSDLNLNYASTDVDDIVNSVAGSATLDNFVHLTGNETVNGIKSFPDGVIANVTGSATSATNDGSGNVISTTYGKLGAYNIWTNGNQFNKFLYIENSQRPIRFGHTTDVWNVQPQQTFYSDIEFVDSQDHVQSYITFQHRADTTETHRICFRVNRTQGDHYVGVNLNNQDELYPERNNAIDLGTSANQWKSVYAQNYYYNGTQWGLDQANVWTNTNTFNQNIVYQRTNFFHRGISPCYYLDDIVIEKGVAPTEDHAAYAGYWRDKNGLEMGKIRFVQYASNDNAQTIELGVYNLQSNGALSKTGSSCSAQLYLKLYPKINSSEFVICANVLTPGYPGISTLGTSTYKWKALNGLNPGCLSLPNPDAGNVDHIDTGTGSGWNTAGTALNTYTPDTDGWLCLACADVAGDFLFASWMDTNGSYPVRASVSGTGVITGASVGSGLCLLLPVKAGKAVSCLTKASSSFYANFIPCLGNV